MGSFENKVVMIEGAVDEVGYAIVSKMASMGAKIAVICINGERLSDMVFKLKNQGIEAMGVNSDPADCTGAKNAIAAVMDKYGRIDVLVNNSDVKSKKAIADSVSKDWYQGLKNNIDPVYFLSREAINVMRNQGYGRIVNIGSVEYLGLPEMSGYSASKSSMLGFTRALALETAKDNITVNWVVKGDIRTSDMSEEQVEKLASKTPVQKVGTPGDVAGAVTFFASETSKFITGQTFFVCGGKSLYFSMSI